MYKICLTIGLTFLLLGFNVSRAQFVPMGNTASSTYNFPNSPNSEQDTLPKGIIYDTEEEADSTLLNSVYYFYLNPLTVKIYEAYHPTLVPTFIEQTDALFSFNNNYYLYTGNSGSPHISLYPQLPKTLGFRYQPDVFGGYGYIMENVPFYQTQRPYTVLSFYNSLNSEYQVRVIHTQNVTQRLNFALHYDLINSKGLYSNQKTLNNYLGATTNYYSKNLRYQVKGGVIWKNLKIQENGGITTDSLFTQNIQTNRGGIPVHLYNAGNHYKTLSVFAHQSYNFASQPGRFIYKDSVFSSTDSSIRIIQDTLYRKGSPFNKGVLAHQISFHQSKRNYYDANINSFYYPHIYLDTTQTFDSVSVYKLENMLFWTNDAYKDYQYKNPCKITLGVKQQMIGIQDIFLYKTINTLLPFGKLEITLGQLSIQMFYEQTFSNSYLNKDLLFSGNISYHLTKHQKIQLSLETARQAPNYFYYRYKSNHFDWDVYSYEKIMTQKIEISYGWKDIITFSSSINNVENNIWLDEQCNPYQTDKSAVLSQTTLNTNVKWGKFHWRTFNVLQFTSDENIFRLPVFAAKHSYFFDFTLFKKTLFLQTGIDIRYNTAFYADAYMPALAAFYRQNEVKIGNTLWLDAFVSLQVKHATIFIKLLHLNTLWETNPRYFYLPHYPGQDFTLQWGFVWRFFD